MMKKLLGRMVTDFLKLLISEIPPSQISPREVKLYVGVHGLADHTLQSGKIEGFKLC